MEKFVHLHVHSQYSVLDGQCSIKDLVNHAIDDGMPALALTDHGVMFGIKELINTVNGKNSSHKKAISSYQEELKSLEEKDNLTAEEETRKG
ncbi:MAG: PHP domain-containing protein, partial [Porphyromonadaceae bacterium]|nr:PHP domain-containing protein [Porphyromonadaceae bacterium]